MTPEAFCIGYFYMNLSNKQISVYADKLKQKAISKLTFYTELIQIPHFSYLVLLQEQNCIDHLLALFELPN